MQRLRISHLTEYRYADWVTFGPHRLRLRPREGHDVRIESSRLDIAPAYDIRWHRDIFDNSVALVTFREGATRLAIASEVIIEHYEETPLDFLVEDYALRYPFLYDGEERIELAAYQQACWPNDRRHVLAWLDYIGCQGHGIETFALLDRINRAIASPCFTYMVREEQGVQSPAWTLHTRTGSCRDYAALFVEACRALGLASRFVSGYVHAPTTEAGNASTHAWSEVYLPGPGWKGFDSTTGEVTGKRHIPVAVARHPESVPPVAGTFFGPAGRWPILTVDVQVVAL
ncbi:MAG: transglutaminase family protein [Burkholderiales bacterium]